MSANIRSVIDGVGFEVFNQWPAALRPWKFNWIDFTFVSFSMMVDKIIGPNLEVEAWLLGLGFRLVVPLPFLDDTKAKEQRAIFDDVRKSVEEGRVVPLDPARLLDPGV